MKGKVTAVSLKATERARENPPLTNPGQFRFLVGRLFQDIPLEEIGPCDLITDLYGVFPYAHDPDLVLAKYLSLLKPGGRIYIFGGSKGGYIERGQIFGGKRDMSLFDWLNMIEGISFEPKFTEGCKVFIISRQEGGKILIPRLDFLYQGRDAGAVPPKTFELV